MISFWRHPKPRGAAGRCVGARSDLGVDPRKAKRLAHRIRAQARRQGSPQRVVCSPLQRCRAVGRWLRRWGWRLSLDAALLEFDFGDWDGQPWDALGPAVLDAWLADFAQHRPGGGESLAALLARAGAWRCPEPGAMVVGHGGWLHARRWVARHGSQAPTPADWTGLPRYGEGLPDFFG